MKHLDNDTVLRFILQSLEEPDQLVAADHLSKCGQCSAMRQKVQMQIDRLGGIELQVKTTPPPRLRKPARLLSVWRWAAVLAAGFLLGYVTARLSDDTRPIPVPQRLIPVRMASPPGYVPCPASDLKMAPGWQ